LRVIVARVMAARLFDARCATGVYPLIDRRGVPATDGGTLLHTSASRDA